jgi:hypothetical protein
MSLESEDTINLTVTETNNEISVNPNAPVTNITNNNIFGGDPNSISTGNADLRYYPLNSNPSTYQNLQSGIQSGYYQLNNGNATASWISPISPKWCILRDDFIGGTNADGQVGELGWRRITLAGSPAFAYISPSENNHHGIISLTPPATLNQGGSLILGGSSLAPLRNFDSIGWDSYFAFKLNVTGIPMKFRLGFSNAIGAGGATEASEGTWLRYDTDASYNDTGYYFVSRSSSSNQHTPIGVKPDTEWHTLRMWTNDNVSINYSFDNISGLIPNRNTSAAKFPVLNMMGGGGAVSPVAYLDYFGFMGYCGR